MIEVVGLSKRFRSFKKAPGFWGAVRGLWRREFVEVCAVRSVSFSIGAGELVGFLGPNGAGKTTTLKMLSGLLYPSGGSAVVMGYRPWERADGYRRQFALLLGQKNQLWWDLPAYESLQLNGRIYGLGYEEFVGRVDELCGLLGVGGKLRVMVRELSLGERMKFELVAALLHRPRLLLLDEPTIGLDVVSQRVVRDFLRDYNGRCGTTMMLTSHYMADVEALCERVIIVDRGEVSFDGGLDEVVGRFGGDKVVCVVWEGRVGPSREWFGGLGEVLEFGVGRVRLRVPRGRVVGVCKRLLDVVGVSDIDVGEVPVEEVIGEVFRRGGVEGGGVGGGRVEGGGGG